jgi:hypothetical protein
MKGAPVMANQNQKYLKRLSDYDVIPATEFLIEPYVPMGGLIFVAGRPKTFKSFLSGIDWGYSVATARKWLGRPTRKGRVAYFALEVFDGVLRRAEAWRLFYKLERADGDNLTLITDRISFAPKTCSANAHLRQFKAEGFRPDLVIVDTWFKVTAGAGVSEQPDMSMALKNVREFQDRLNEWKVEDGLPEVTVVVNAHTTYKGDKLFGSITQFADCDVLYQLERAPHANLATLECVDARDIEIPPTITFEMEKVPIVTAKGKEHNLVISKEVSILDQPGEDAAEVQRKSRKQQRHEALDELVYMAAVSLANGPERLVQYNGWFELAKARRGKQGLGNDSFRDAVKRLEETGRVRKVGDLYQVVFDTGPEDGTGAPEGPDPRPDPVPGTPESTPSTPDSWYYSNTRSARSRSTPRSTPGVSGVTSTNNGNGHSAVAPDKAQQALERLLNKKSPPSV